MQKFNQGDKVKIKDPRKENPAPKTYGQGDYPDGLSVTVNGENVTLKWGALFKVSSYTNAAVASLDSSPMPLLSKDWVNGDESINEMFELVEAAE